MADWPVTFPCSSGRSSSFSLSSDGGVYIDGTFGAGGYARAILAQPRRARARHRSRPHGDRARAPIWSTRRTGASRVSEGRFSALDTIGGCVGHRVRRRRRPRSRRLVDAARHRRTRLLLPLRRAARHAHGGARARRAADVVAAASERDLARIIACSARSGTRAQSPARSCARAARQPIRTTARARRDRRARRRIHGRATSIRPPARSRRCVCS